MGIKEGDQIKEMDIVTLADSNSPEELRNRVENIKAKFQKITSRILEVQA